MAHKISLPSVQQVVYSAELEEGGRIQSIFTHTLHRMSDEYTPFDNGILKNTSRVIDNDTAIEYNTPYAQYLWYGKLMVDRVTFSSWARAGTRKIMDPQDRDLNYHKGPLRSSKWVERAFKDNEDAIIRMLERAVNE